MEIDGNGEVTDSDVRMLSDDDDDDDDMLSDDDEMDLDLSDIGETYLTNFCKKASSAFFKQYGLINHQITSFNNFLKYGIQNVFDSIGDIRVEPVYDPSKKGSNGEWKHALIRFGKVQLEPPTFWTGDSFQAEGGQELIKLLPRHARLQNMTYSARLQVETHLEVYTVGKVQSDKFRTGMLPECVRRTTLKEETDDVIIGRIPVMVKSDICWMSKADKMDCEFDHGGYFIVKGAEKAFIAQEQSCLRRLWVSNDVQWRVCYRSESKRKRVYIKLVENEKIENLQGGEKVLSVYCLSVEFPVWILFFALGVKSDEEVLNLIEYGNDDGCITNILLASICEANEACDDFRKEGKAFEFIDNVIRQSKFPPSETTIEVLEKNLFPSLVGNKRKARFVGYMVKCLLQAFSGRRKCDNRDDFRNKRMNLGSELLMRELRVHMKHAEKRMVKALQKDLNGDRELKSIDHYFDPSIVSNGLARAFSTGGWSHPFKRGDRISGVVTNLRRTNPLQAVCDMRKTRQQVSYTGKVGDARYPHPSHWGKLCFLSTPDGENCGLVKNLAATGIVSTRITEPVIEKLVICGMEELVDDTATCLNGKDKVLLDGEWVGVCADSYAFVEALRRTRRRKQLPEQVEIKHDVANGEVRVFCDAGRILRPLLVVENMRKIKSLKGENHPFQKLIDKGIVEFVGVEEEEDCCTAWEVKYLFKGEKGKDNIKYTHCELDMSLLLGISCGIIPFANHDHARRVLYQSEKHSGQAIGFSTTNPNIRSDTLTHQLYYPQKPLFRSVISDCLGRSAKFPNEEFFNGQTAIVAVNVHHGFNQEDSLVMNRASVERGMFRTEHIRSYKAEVDNMESVDKRKRFGDVVKFGKVEGKFGRVDSLDDDGFPYVGASLQSGDIIIGRVGESGADHSVKLKYTERGMVQKVVLSANDEGKNFAVVSLRQVRSPCLGDKFSSMHGQKGVVGYLESHENLPFNEQGIVPDIVINPHAFPSRQTPGQLLEAALSKGIACGGSLKYATPFSTPSVEAIKDQLLRAGFSRWGHERVYNGRTGEMVRTLIFTGPTFYQRLVHMAEDKVKYRNTGPVHPLTRQPVADRKRFGGIKFGEMERDCIIAHGASANLHERLFTLSDYSHIHVCNKCRTVADVILRTLPGGKKIRGPYCRFCDSAEGIVKVSVPYGAKLMTQELFSMGISLKFDTRVS